MCLDKLTDIQKVKRALMCANYLAGHIGQVDVGRYLAKFSTNAIKKLCSLLFNDTVSLQR